MFLEEEAMQLATRSRSIRASSRPRRNSKAKPPTQSTTSRIHEVLVSDDDRARYDDPVQDALAILPILYREERVRHRVSLDDVIRGAAIVDPVEAALAKLPVLSSEEDRSEKIRTILQAIASGDINGLALTYLAAMTRGFAAEERRHDELALKRVAEEEAQLTEQKREALKERTRTAATSR
jgi:hypothetical protein